MPEAEGAIRVEAGDESGKAWASALCYASCVMAGRIGRVSSLPTELQVVESARVRVLEVEFEDGEKAVVPRANVEMIE